ncbi:MAG TPA: quinoprotein dehydrogenase-associated putative ABC transporter substrate-binding protein [Ideonella sp.]|nr:quinoprotein dehydrogenase-associated putative ABC transporter substrate-binding protein [Ideonella sp.]
MSSPRPEPCAVPTPSWRHVPIFAAGAAALLLALAPAPAHAFGLSWSTFAGADGAHLDAANDAPATHVLRVCADPDNLPYSKRDGSGFENRIAALMARALKARLETVWSPRQRGWLRSTLGADRCDALIGVPAGTPTLLTTRPYYRSSWVLVGRGDTPPLAGLDDPRLAQWRVGVSSADGEWRAAPRVVLARVGALDHAVDVAPHGDAPPAERMVDALADGRLDAALLWGPQAGYYAGRASVPLRLAPLAAPGGDASGFEASIAMGVARGHAMLRAALDRAIAEHREEIDAILAEYRVPRADLGVQRLVQDRR